MTSGVKRCFADRRIAVALCATALAVLASEGASAFESTPMEDAIERLAAATEAYPDDPDLAWAYANALSRAGNSETAAERMIEYAARWPSRRSDVQLATGRMLFEAGRTTDALPRLQRAVEAEPKSGLARFFYALALREVGRRQEARLELIRSGRMSPNLLPDSTLLLSIDAFAAGDEEAGIELAQKVIELDPTSDAAARARMLLDDKELRATKRALQLDAYAGVAYDDNVTLVSNDDEVPATEEEDVFGAWGLGVGWRQPLTDKALAMAGYRFDQRMYDQEDDFDTINNALFLSGLFRVHEKVAIRLDGIGWHTRRGGDPYQWAGSFRPSVMVALPEGTGLLRFFANVEWVEFDDDPFDPSLEAGGLTVNGGVEWTTAIPKLGGTASISTAFQETMTEAEQSDFAVDDSDFEGDYDQRALRVHTALRIPMWWEIELGAEGTYIRSWYRNDNFVDFFNQFLTLPVDEIDIRKRRDHFVGGRFYLSRPLHRFVTMDVEWKPGWRMSNLDSYDYKRHVVGLRVRVQSD